MMFFTVRAIPETTTASFAVDELVMVAVYVYLEILTLQLSPKRLRHSIQQYFVIPAAMSKSGAPVRVADNRQA
jgi:uncharacterized membrane protein SirB2